MRDEFGEIDPDEIDIIDLVEPDVSAFAAHGESELPAAAHRRRWVLAAGVTSAVGIAVAGLLVWSPWREDNTRSFADSATPELTLTDELVFDIPPAELTASSLGTATTDDSFLGTFGEYEGYFFAEQGVSWDVFSGQSTGRWAAFFAAKQEDEDGPDMEVDDRETAGAVQGAPAVVGPVDGGIREITFGPVDGLMFSVVSSGMSLTDSLTFAEAVGVDDGVPTLSNASVIGAMLPIGDMADYDVAVSTMIAATSPLFAQPGVVSVHYGDFSMDGELNEDSVGYSIATRPLVGDPTLGMLRFTLGGEEGHSVHGLPAIVVDKVGDRLGFAGGQGSSLVAWVEGGRLIIVTGPDDVDATLALAESVRPATQDEWVEVVAVVQDPFAPDDPVFVDQEGVVLYEGVDPATGDTFAFTVQFTDGFLVTSVEQRSGGSTDVGFGNMTDFELPLLTTDESTERKFVLAVIDRAEADGAELRITLADGTIETFPLVDVAPEFPGPAVATLLPEDHGAVELWNAGELVASL